MSNNGAKAASTDASAVIVGASLSGLMTGIALAREGLQVTIVEKADENRPSGAGLQVNGGFFDRTKTAKLLRKLAAGGKKSVQLWSSIETRLRTEAKTYDNIALHYHTRIQTVDQDNDAAWVVTDNNETFRADMLIGADGHRSVVRSHVAPQKPNATFAGYVVWFVAVKEDELPKNKRPSRMAPNVRILNSINGFSIASVIDGGDGDGRRIGCTWYDNTRNDLLRRLGCVEGGVVDHSLKGTDIPEENLVELADQAYDRWPEPWLSAALHAIRNRNLTAIPIKEYVPDNLVNGRMALVGDAAHVPAPITASGVNESLQDAVELGKSVAKGLTGKASAQSLQDYESARLNKVRQVVQSGKSFSQSFGRL